MRADNSHHLIAAARERAEQTHTRALLTLRRLDEAGVAVTFEAIAREAGVSRSWLYGQADLRAEIEALRTRSRTSSPASFAPAATARQRRIPPPQTRSGHRMAAPARARQPATASGARRGARQRTHRPRHGNDLRTRHARAARPETHRPVLIRATRSLRREHVQDANPQVSGLTLRTTQDNRGQVCQWPVLELGDDLFDDRVVTVTLVGLNHVQGGVGDEGGAP